MAIDTLSDGPADAPAQLILAHGAGQGMNSPFMSEIAQRLASDDLRVVRFNFPYMQQRAQSGNKRPPDREAKLLDCWREMVNEVRQQTPDQLYIGGKSMGGRMASLLADELEVDGLICLGYPFHPPGKPERLRTQHLINLHTPTLICQGERDSFGKPDEISVYSLSPQITIHWIADGDHSFKPRKSSGLTLEHNLDSATRAILQFIGALS